MSFPFPPWSSPLFYGPKVNFNAVPGGSETQYLADHEVNFITSSISSTQIAINLVSGGYNVLSGNLNASATIWNAHDGITDSLAVKITGVAYLTSSIFTPDGDILTITGTGFAVKAAMTDANNVAGIEMSSSLDNVSTGFDIRTHRDFASSFLKVVDDGVDAHTRFQQVGYYDATAGAPQLDVFAGLNTIQDPADQVSIVCNTRLEVEAQYIALNAYQIQLTGSPFSPAAKIYATNGLEIYSDAGISMSGATINFDGWLNTNQPLGIDFGNHDIGIGWYALDQHKINPLTFGGMNVAVGFQSQQFNSGGWDNIALGFQSLMFNAAGNSNIAIGSSAATNTSASDNIVIGVYALNENNTGSSNVAIGSYAMRAVTGSHNIAIGSDAGRHIVGGTNNINTNKSIFIGSGTIAANDGGIDEIVIGVGATGHGSNTVTIGSPTTTNNFIHNQLEVDSGDAIVRLHSDNGIGLTGLEVVQTNAATDAGIVVSTTNELKGQAWISVFENAGNHGSDFYLVGYDLATNKTNEFTIDNGNANNGVYIDNTYSVAVTSQNGEVNLTSLGDMNFSSNGTGSVRALDKFEILGATGSILYMHSPNGNRWALKIGNDGVISTVLAP